ncbi:unnamed protein product [Gordionus sp. m RMFG-2023]
MDVRLSRARSVETPDPTGKMEHSGTSVGAVWFRVWEGHLERLSAGGITKETTKMGRRSWLHHETSLKPK